MLVRGPVLAHPAGLPGDGAHEGEALGRYPLPRKICPSLNPAVQFFFAMQRSSLRWFKKKKKKGSHQNALESGNAGMRWIGGPVKYGEASQSGCVRAAAAGGVRT